MERCFIVTKESEFLIDLEKYKPLELKQRNFVNDFMNEKGIEADKYMVSGNGFVNTPFEEFNKSEISLNIVPTENDIKNFSKLLKNPNNNHGLCGFKKNSSISKEFAQKCVDNKIVINLCIPREGEYFRDLGFRKYKSQYFNHNGIFYLKIESDYLKKDDTPKGFVEIKQSEYYLAKEELEKRK